MEKNTNPIKSFLFLKLQLAYAIKLKHWHVSSIYACSYVENTCTTSHKYKRFEE